MQQFIFEPAYENNVIPPQLKLDICLKHRDLNAKTEQSLNLCSQNVRYFSKKIFHAWLRECVLETYCFCFHFDHFSAVPLHAQYVPKRLKHMFHVMLLSLPTLANWKAEK